MSSPAKQKERPVVIVKKKRGGSRGAHHGGSWKVAYADFVTAMMAFFMVMWLINLDQSTKSAIGGYFSNPTAFRTGGAPSIAPNPLSAPPSTVDPVPMQLALRAQERSRFERAAEALRRRIEENQAELGLNTLIEITVTEEGLRIELVEDGDGDTFFPLSSAIISETGRKALTLIGAELAELTAAVVIEGHTDAMQYSRQATYTNWELSADRANAARRILEREGVSRSRVVGVRGLADRYLRVPEEPDAAANRRISILLPFSDVLEQLDGRRDRVLGA